MKRVLLITVFCLVASAATAQTRYRVFSSGVNFDPFRIGGSGTIVGGDQPERAFDRAWGVTTIHGFAYDNDTWVQDVNSSSIAVGASYFQVGPNTYQLRAFKWDRVAGISEVATFPGPSYAYGINDYGVIVGQLDNYPADSQPFLYTPGQGWVTLLPKYGGYAGAHKVNNHGQVLGYTMAPGNSNDQRIVVWNPDGTIIDLGNMGPQYQNFDFDLNNRGWVCGCTNGPWGNTGYVWNPVTGYTPVFNPFTPYGYCAMNGLNDANVGVGTLYINYDRWYGFYRALDGTITRLDDLLDPVAKAQGWIITDCYDINNLGQIAAVGERNGQRYGVLLQPVPGGTLGFIPPTAAWP